MAEMKTASGEPGGYYTSKYSGEEIDALLDSIAQMQGEIQTLADAQGISFEGGGGG